MPVGTVAEELSGAAGCANGQRGTLQLTAVQSAPSLKGHWASISGHMAKGGQDTPDPMSGNQDIVASEAHFTAGVQLAPSLKGYWRLGHQTICQAIGHKKAEEVVLHPGWRTLPRQQLPYLEKHTEICHQYKSNEC